LNEKNLEDIIIEDKIKIRTKNYIKFQIERVIEHTKIFKNYHTKPTIMREKELMHKLWHVRPPSIVVLGFLHFPLSSWSRFPIL